MDVDLNQFQTDLLESVREMKTRQVVPLAEIKNSSDEQQREMHVSSSATSLQTVSETTEDSDR